MPHSHRELFYHLVWTTKNRYPYISPALRAPLLAHLRKKAAGLGCQVFAAECVPDHVHVLLYIPPNLTVARTVRELKGFSSHELRCICLDFAWQEGYGAHTLRRSDLRIVQAYIENQARRHKSPDLLDAGLEDVADTISARR
ncbi:MAG: IS200/IS605 family transposase [Patescibacteria group bacterium]